MLLGEVEKLASIAKKSPLSVYRKGQIKGEIDMVKSIIGREKGEQWLGIFSKIVEDTSEGVILSDLEGYLLFVNNALVLMHGYPAKELVGRHLSSLHTAEQMPAVEAANRQTLDTGEFSGEIWHVRRDGTTFPTLTHSRLFLEEAGEPICMIGTIRDITDFKRAEKCLRESEERYRSLFENTSDAIFVADKKTGVIVEANRQAEKLIGSSKDEIIGVHHSKLHPPQHAEHYKNKFRNHIQTDHILDFEAEVIKKNGGVVRVLIKASVITLDGKEMIQAIFRDITGEKRMLELREELASRKLIERAKGILMDHHNISEKEAMRRLQKESRRQRKKIKEIARTVISIEFSLH